MDTKNVESGIEVVKESGLAHKVAASRRYNLVLPEDLFNEVQRLADTQHTTVVELLRRFVKLGLLAIQLQNSPDAALIIREGEREREILLV